MRALAVAAVSAASLVVLLGCQQGPGSTPQASPVPDAVRLGPEPRAANDRPPVAPPSPQAGGVGVNLRTAPGYTNPPPLVAGAHWHHFHVNSTDPARSIAFYTRHFDAKAARFADMADAVWTQKSWILFNRVNAAPSQAHDTAIWHIGWGAPDPQQAYARQQALGAVFMSPFTDIASTNNGTPGRFWFFYTQSPDGTWIEQNTARTDNFGHMHMFSADPVATGDWYIRFFGVTGRALSTPTTPTRAVRLNTRGLQTGPGSSLYFDNVNMIIYPMQYSQKAYPVDWEPGQTELAPTRGNVNDHFGVSVPSLDEALRVFRANGVRVTAEPVNVPGKFRFAFIEGPDHMAIEIIEDHSGHPPEEE
jgi:catechol 2,3-dioxygenase-like lactoylglutathione lyase family enzyme